MIDYQAVYNENIMKIQCEDEWGARVRFSQAYNLLNPNDAACFPEDVEVKEINAKMTYKVCIIENIPRYREYEIEAECAEDAEEFVMNGLGKQMCDMDARTITSEYDPERVQVLETVEV